MAEEGHTRGYANHGFAHEGEGGEESHRLRVKMQHVDLIMLKHRVEEGGEGRNQASPEGIYEDWDLGGRLSRASARRRPSHRLPHSLKLVASIGRRRKGRRRSW